MNWLIVALVVANVLQALAHGLRIHRDYKTQMAVQRVIDAETDLERVETAEPIGSVPGVTRGTYRKKPLTVEARQWDGSYLVAQLLLDWLGEDRGVYQEAVVPAQTSDVAPLPAEPGHLFVYCAEGAVEVFPGWWIVKEPGWIGSRAFSVLAPEDMEDQLDLIEAT